MTDTKTRPCAGCGAPTPAIDGWGVLCERCTRIVTDSEEIAMDAGSGVMTWWKATRPDGTDFYTGTVDYAAALASGEPTPELSGEGEFPGEGWYHLATVPTECVGMLWPCRLFEVEPVGDQTLDTEHPYKVGCRQVRVVREVDGHIALGPQGADVVALIARARALTGDDVKRLGAARDAAWDAALDAARSAAGGAARDAAWDAALALVSRDLIGHRPGWDQAVYDLLTGPWRSVIGPVHPDDTGDESTHNNS